MTSKKRKGLVGAEVNNPLGNLLISSPWPGWRVRKSPRPEGVVALGAISNMFNDNRTLIDEAKRRVPISLAAEKLGLGKIKPNGVQRSPFREDRHASFSVTDDTLWQDFSTNEGGDVISFIVAASGCTVAAAITGLLAMAGIERGAPLPAAKPRPPISPRPIRDALSPLTLSRPLIAELAEIQHRRKWPVFSGLEIAHERGLLFAANVTHRHETVRSYVLTDAARKTGMARKINGEQWSGPDGSTFKSLSLRSDPENPIGLADVVGNDRRVVLLAEGDPDFLAAITFAWLADCVEKVGFIRLDGNRRAMTPSVAEALRGRRARILRQYDQPRKSGESPAAEFAAAWSAALLQVGVEADAVFAERLRPPGSTGDFDFADVLALPLNLDQHSEIACKIMKGLCA